MWSTHLPWPIFSILFTDERISYLFPHLWMDCMSLYALEENLIIDMSYDMVWRAFSKLNALCNLPDEQESTLNQKFSTTHVGVECRAITNHQVWYLRIKGLISHHSSATFTNSYSTSDRLLSSFTTNLAGSVVSMRPHLSTASLIDLSNMSISAFRRIIVVSGFIKSTALNINTQLNHVSNW